MTEDDEFAVGGQRSAYQRESAAKEHIPVRDGVPPRKHASPNWAASRGAAAPEQMQDKRNDGNDQKKVDQATGDVKS